MAIRRVVITFAAAFALLVAGGEARAATFTFDALALFTPTPLTLTEEGVTATFTSVSGNQFFVADAFFAGATGRVLVVDDEVVNSLAVSFSGPQDVFNVLFGLNTFDNTVPFSLTAYLGAAEVGTSSATGVGPGFASGTLGFSGATFDRVVLTSPARDFAIDTLTVRPAQTPVPEPHVLTLLAGAIGAALARRRRIG